MKGANLRTGTHGSLTILLMILLQYEPVAGCLCMSPPTPDLEFERMDAVFAGQVSIIDTVYDYWKEVTFSIHKSWKGVDEDHVSVITAMDESGCGYDFKVDSLYLVYADSNMIYRIVDDNLEGTIQTHICTRTKTLSEAQEDFAYLNSLLIGDGQWPKEAIPTEFALRQNYPNPFNPTTTIEFSIPQSGIVTLTVYNILGKEVDTILNKHMQAGHHKVQWNASYVSSGIYFIKMKSGDFSQVRKVMVLR